MGHYSYLSVEEHKNIMGSGGFKFEIVCKLAHKQPPPASHHESSLICRCVQAISASASFLLFSSSTASRQVLFAFCHPSVVLLDEIGPHEPDE